MNRHWSLLNLDLVAHGGIIGAPALPRVLASVYRDRESGDILLPPFSVVGDEVFNAVLASDQELEEQIARESLSRLPQPIPAQVGFDLWVDDGGVVSYDAKSRVKQAFEALFQKHLEQANRSLDAQQWEQACQHSVIARSVKPSHLDPLVIRAVAESKLGDLSRLSFTRHLAADYVSATEFDRLVAARLGDDPVAESHRAQAMRGAAARRPAPILEAA